MDTVNLLHSAEAAGLVVTDRGHQIHIRGPKSAEPIVRQLIENKHVVLIALKQQAGWDREAANLIVWFLDEGRYQIPSEPFQLSPWQRIVGPGIFIKAILFDISLGPSTPKNLYGALTADLQRLKELFGNNPTSKEDSL